MKKSIFAKVIVMLVTTISASNVFAYRHGNLEVKISCKSADEKVIVDYYSKGDYQRSIELTENGKARTLEQNRYSGEEETVSILLTNRLDLKVVAIKVLNSMGDVIMDLIAYPNTINVIGKPEDREQKGFFQASFDKGTLKVLKQDSYNLNCTYESN